jgi:hypothetical protein
MHASFAKYSDCKQAIFCESKADLAARVPKSRQTSSSWNRNGRQKDKMTITRGNETPGLSSELALGHNPSTKGNTHEKE